MIRWLIIIRLPHCYEGIYEIVRVNICRFLGRFYGNSVITHCRTDTQWHDGDSKQTSGIRLPDITG